MYRPQIDTNSVVLRKRNDYLELEQSVKVYIYMPLSGNDAVLADASRVVK